MKAIILFMFFAAGAFAAEIGPISLQRRNDVEFSHGVLNDAGEITYTVDDAGRGVLTLGAAEGNTVVGDPFAIHLAPQRILSPDEYGVEITGGELTSAGAYEIFDAYKVAGTVRTLTLAPVNPLVKIARVTYDSSSYLIDIDKTTTEGGMTLTCTSDYDSFWDPSGNGAHMYVSNLVVYAWTGDARVSTVDFTLSDLAVTDDLGGYNMSELRSWITARYDSTTGDQWSKFAATHPVRLADRQIWFDSLGVTRLGALASSGTNRVSITVNGTSIMEITPGASEYTDMLKIVDYEMGATQAVFYVAAALLSPVTLQTTPTLDPLDWSDVSTGLVSSYPTTSIHTVDDTTYTVYTLTLSIDPEAATGFYRIKSSVGAIGATTLEIKNCALIYQGHPLGIVTQVVDGVSYEVLGRVLN